ncbi:hypothetical protein [Prescottella equi]|uniref:hypothetical protein n=1 Tax=Rhodococcus hoagii TaxID=43767 RepID=UPI00111BE8BE|nr:hypothetical protein [Prescottella equi]
MNENSLPTASTPAASGQDRRTIPPSQFTVPVAPARLPGARTGWEAGIGKPGAALAVAVWVLRAWREGRAGDGPVTEVRPTPDLAAHIRTTPAMLRDAVLLLRTDLSRVTRADEHQAKVEAEEVAAYEASQRAITASDARRFANVEEEAPGERPTLSVAPKPRILRSSVFAGQGNTRTSTSDLGASAPSAVDLIGEALARSSRAEVLALCAIAAAVLETGGPQ